MKRLSQVLAANSFPDICWSGFESYQWCMNSGTSTLVNFFGIQHKDAETIHLSAVLMVKVDLNSASALGDKNGWHLSDALEYQPHTHEAEPGGHPDPEMLELTRLSGGDQVSIPRLNSFNLRWMNRGSLTVEWSADGQFHTFPTKHDHSSIHSTECEAIFFSERESMNRFGKSIIIPRIINNDPRHHLFLEFPDGLISIKLHKKFVLIEKHWSTTQPSPFLICPSLCDWRSWVPFQPLLEINSTLNCVGVKVEIKIKDEGRMSLANPLIRNQSLTNLNLGYIRQCLYDITVLKINIQQKYILYFEFHLTSMNSSVSAVEITQDIQDGLFKIELITETKLMMTKEERDESFSSSSLY